MQRLFFIVLDAVVLCFFAPCAFVADDMFLSRRAAVRTRSKPSAATTAIGWSAVSASSPTGQTSSRGAWLCLGHVRLVGLLQGSCAGPRHVCSGGIGAAVLDKDRPMDPLRVHPFVLQKRWSCKYCASPCIQIDREVALLCKQTRSTCGRTHALSCVGSSPVVLSQSLAVAPKFKEGVVPFIIQLLAVVSSWAN